MTEFIQLLSKALNELNMFVTDTRVYKKEYVFRRQPLHEILIGYSHVVYGHLNVKQADVQMQILNYNGSFEEITEENKTVVTQYVQSYTEWHEYSLAITGG